MKYPATQIKRNLKKAISKVTDNPERYSSKPGKDFTRARKLPMKKVIESILAMGGKDLKCEMMNLFDFSTSAPTVSAFVQQRGKLSASVFETIFHEFTQASASKKPLYKGFRLLAVDGSDLHVPTNEKAPESYYPGANGQKPYNLLHLNALYDVMQHLYLDAVIQGSHQRNEHKAFVTMVDRDESTIPTIYMADRGFESYNNMAHIQEKHQYFLIRIKDIGRGSIASNVSVPDTDEFDIPLHISLSRKQTKACKQNPDLIFVPHTSTFDFLPAKCIKSVDVPPYTIPCRMVRLEISADNYEILLTNLSPNAFSPTDLKQLYAMRWGIETSFRSLKYSLGLIAFHSKKTENICQEIFAKLTMYNFSELIISQIMFHQKQRKYPYKANFSAAVLICSQFFLKNISPSEVDLLILKHLVPIKPSKSNPRKLSQRSSIAFLYRIP